MGGYPSGTDVLFIHLGQCKNKNGYNLEHRDSTFSQEDLQISPVPESQKSP